MPPVKLVLLNALMPTDGVRDVDALTIDDTLTISGNGEPVAVADILKVGKDVILGLANALTKLDPVTLADMLEVGKGVILGLANALTERDPVVLAVLVKVGNGVILGLANALTGSDPVALADKLEVGKGDVIRLANGLTAEMGDTLGAAEGLTEPKLDVMRLLDGPLTGVRVADTLTLDDTPVANGVDDGETVPAEKQPLNDTSSSPITVVYVWLVATSRTYKSLDIVGSKTLCSLHACTFSSALLQMVDTGKEIFVGDRISSLKSEVIAEVPM